MSEIKPSMSEIKLGNKYDCFSCGIKFYDLGKGAAVCPKCGADQKDAGDKNNPLMSQSVRRRRRSELATVDDSASASEAEVDEGPLDADAELAEDDLELVDDEDEEEDVEEP